MLFVNNPENFRLSRKIIVEKFGGYQKKPYLCIRFRPKNGVEHQKEKEFFERFP